MCVTNKSLPKGFILLERWGFRYAACMTWCKPTMTSGNYFCFSSDHILFATRGSLELARRDVGTWFDWPARAMDREKPDQFYDLVKTCSPGPYAVLFSRKPRDGWFCWTGEIEDNS